MWLLWYSVICFFGYLTICYSTVWLLSYSVIRLVRYLTISPFSYSPIRLLVTFWLKIDVLGLIYGDPLDPNGKRNESLRIDQHLDRWGAMLGKPREKSVIWRSVRFPSPPHLLCLPSLLFLRSAGPYITEVRRVALVICNTERILD